MLAVLGALFANGLIAILKFIGAAITGSSGMMAEALHSVADTTNQIFLLLGLRFYKRPASEKHLLVTVKNGFSGLSSQLFLFLASARLTRSTKASKNSGIRIRRRTLNGLSGCLAFRFCWRLGRSDWRSTRKSKRRTTKA